MRGWARPVAESISHILLSSAPVTLPMLLRVPNSREWALTDQTTLDVTRYARLWRLTWWTQHVAWPLAVFGAGVILLAFVWQALGQLDGWEKYIVNQISLRPQFTEAEREFLRPLAVALFRLGREGAGPGLPWAATMAAALLFELVAYLLGCGRFRLPLLSLSLAALIVTAAVALLGIDYALKLAPDGEMFEMFAPERPVNAQTLYDQGIFTIAGMVACASLPLLTLRGIAILLLWRHRLRPDLPRTQRMTRSLGVNLTIPQFAWPHPSLAGFAVHACTLLVSGTLAYLFWGWIAHALIFGSVNLFFFVFDTPIILLDILFKFLTGSPLGLANDWAQFLRSIDNLPQLLLLIGVLLLARALWRVGRRLNLLRRNEIILRDKPPVLLLRSFTDDVDGIPSNMLIQRLFWRRKRLEEIIGEQLDSSRPVRGDRQAGRAAATTRREPPLSWRLRMADSRSVLYLAIGPYHCDCRQDALGSVGTRQRPRARSHCRASDCFSPDHRG